MAFQTTEYLGTSCNVIYIDPSATGLNTGESPTDAYTTFPAFASDSIYVIRRSNHLDPTAYIQLPAASTAVTGRIAIIGMPIPGDYFYSRLPNEAAAPGTDTWKADTDDHAQILLPQATGAGDRLDLTACDIGVVIERHFIKIPEDYGTTSAMQWAIYTNGCDFVKINNLIIRREHKGAGFGSAELFDIESVFGDATGRYTIDPSEEGTNKGYHPTVIGGGFAAFISAVNCTNYLSITNIDMDAVVTASSVTQTSNTAQLFKNTFVTENCERAVYENIRIKSIGGTRVSPSAILCSVNDIFQPYTSGEFRGNLHISNVDIDTYIPDYQYIGAGGDTGTGAHTGTINWYGGCTFLGGNITTVQDVNIKVHANQTVNHYSALTTLGNISTDQWEEIKHGIVVYASDESAGSTEFRQRDLIFDATEFTYMQHGYYSNGTTNTWAMVHVFPQGLDGEDTHKEIENIQCLTDYLAPNLNGGRCSNVNTATGMKIVTSGSTTVRSLRALFGFQTQYRGLDIACSNTIIDDGNIDVQGKLFISNAGGFTRVTNHEFSGGVNNTHLNISGDNSTVVVDNATYSTGTWTSSPITQNTATTVLISNINVDIDAGFTMVDPGALVDTILMVNNNNGLTGNWLASSHFFTARSWNVTHDSGSAVLKFDGIQTNDTNPLKIAPMPFKGFLYTPQAGDAAADPHGLGAGWHKIRINLAFKNYSNALDDFAKHVFIRVRTREPIAKFITGTHYVYKEYTSDAGAIQTEASTEWDGDIGLTAAFIEIPFQVFDDNEDVEVNLEFDWYGLNAYMYMDPDFYIDFDAYGSQLRRISTLNP